MAPIASGILAHAAGRPRRGRATNGVRGGGSTSEGVAGVRSRRRRWPRRGRGRRRAPPAAADVVEDKPPQACAAAVPAARVGACTPTDGRRRLRPPIARRRGRGKSSTYMLQRVDVTKTTRLHAAAPANPS